MSDIQPGRSAGEAQHEGVVTSPGGAAAAAEQPAGGGRSAATGWQAASLTPAGMADITWPGDGV